MGSGTSSVTRRQTNHGVTLLGGLLSLSFGGPLSAASNSGQWTARWLSDRWTSRPCHSAETGLRTAETRRAGQRYLSSTARWECRPIKDIQTQQFCAKELLRPTPGCERLS